MIIYKIINAKLEKKNSRRLIKIKIKRIDCSRIGNRSQLKHHQQKKRKKRRFLMIKLS